MWRWVLDSKDVDVRVLRLIPDLNRSRTITWPAAAFTRRLIHLAGSSCVPTVPGSPMLTSCCTSTLRALTNAEQRYGAALYLWPLQHSFYQWPHVALLVPRLTSWPTPSIARLVTVGDLWPGWWWSAKTDWPGAPTATTVRYRWIRIIKNKSFLPFVLCIDSLILTFLLLLDFNPWTVSRIGFL